MKPYSYNGKIITASSREEAIKVFAAGSKKYEFTGKTRNFKGHTLHQIRALKNFGKIEKGRLGGWIESEKNLSQAGNCWVYEDAKVYENAKVYDDALIGESIVYGNACVYGKAELSERCKIYGKAQIFGKSFIRYDSRIYDEAKIFGNCYIMGSKIYGKAQVYGNAEVSDCCIYENAQVYGKARINDSTIHGNVQVCNAWFKHKEFSGNEKITKSIPVERIVKRCPAKKCS